MKARLLGHIKDRAVFRFPVKVKCGQNASLLQTVEGYEQEVVTVIAPTAKEAADFVADKLKTIPCVQLEVFGTKGGVAAHRYWGWDRAIFNRLLQSRSDQPQLL